MQKEALKKYQEDVKAYKEYVRKYSDIKSEYDERLREQTNLLNAHFDRIVSALFKQSMAAKVKMRDCDNSPQRGAYEDKFFYALMKERPCCIKNDKVFDFYFPDIVFDNGQSCPVDIEIDEPYEYKTKREIHYIGCGDEERNSYFTENNWFVLRFSENQIKTHILECVAIVRAFAQFIEYGDTSKLYEVEKIIYNIQECRWTKELSRMMAIEDYRSKDTL